MGAPTPLLKLIAARAAGLPPSQRALARHVLADHHSLAFSTVADLARAAGVSEATVVRFASALGFAGYPGLQQEVRRLVRADLKGTERFELAAPPAAAAGPLARTLRQEAGNLARLRDAADPAALARAAVAIAGARRVLVAGARASAPLALHLGFAFDKLGLDAVRTLSADTEARDRLGRMGAGDVIVVIGFPRYLRSLQALLDLAGRRGVTRIVVTDSPFSALQGEIALHAPAESASFVAFHAAPLVLLNALVEAVAAADRDRSHAALAAFEAVAESESYFTEA